MTNEEQIKMLEQKVKEEKYSVEWHKKKMWEAEAMVEYFNQKLEQLKLEVENGN